MNAMTADITVSPVNMEDRQSLGLKPGDTVRVHQKIQERGKTRIQVFEGLVLARKHGNEPGATFIVRKVTDGIGVERTFPLYSPLIDKIEIIRRSKVRRAKLYYIREKVAREIKRQMRRMKLTAIATESETEAAARAEAEETQKAEEEAAKAEAEAAKAAEAIETQEAEVSADIEGAEANETSEDVPASEEQQKEEKTFEADVTETETEEQTEEQKEEEKK